RQLDAALAGGEPGQLLGESLAGAGGEHDVGVLLMPAEDEQDGALWVDERRVTPFDRLSGCRRRTAAQTAQFEQKIGSLRAELSAVVFDSARCGHEGIDRKST